MNIIYFDNGGTLINDPFQEVINVLAIDFPKLDNDNYNLDKDNINIFLEYWRKENYKNDFPFASHFLQEELWITNVLLG